MTEFKYIRGAEIFGEAEPAEYVYQVVEGAVRSYKLLSDGRRQIGAFHLVGDIFGLENGAMHRFTAEAIVDTSVRISSALAVSPIVLLYDLDILRASRPGTFGVSVKSGCGSGKTSP